MNQYLFYYISLDGNLQSTFIDADGVAQATKEFERSYEFAEILKIKHI